VAPGRLDLEIVRGDTFRHPLAFTSGGSALNVSTSTWRAQLRTPSGELAATFAVDTSGAASGAVVLELEPAETSTLAPGKHVWDLEQITAGDTKTVLGGSVVVLADVTR
jgi:hypothetical protein